MGFQPCHCENRSLNFLLHLQIFANLDPSLLMWRGGWSWNGPSRSNCYSENSIRKSSRTVPTQVRNERYPASVPASKIFGWLELGLESNKPYSSCVKLHNPQMLARVNGQSSTSNFCFLLFFSWLCLLATEWNIESFIHKLIMTFTALKNWEVKEDMDILLV